MATIRILHNGDETVLDRFLVQRVESSMFLLSNLRAAGLNDRGREYEGTYAAAFDGSELIGVAALYWIGSLILQAPVELIPSLCQTLVEASTRTIGAILGPASQVARARDVLAFDGVEVQQDELEPLYALELADLVVPSLLSSGRVQARHANDEDDDLLTRWRVSYSIEALGARKTPELRTRARQGVVRGRTANRIWLLEHEGAPVATSSFNAATVEAVQVGGVWTPPALRGRGYGRSVVAASLMEARETSVEKAILFTGESNVGAQKAYVAIGFQHIDNFRLVLLRDHT